MGLYAFTLHHWLTGKEIADISNLCIKRHFVMTRNRSGLIELELDLFKAEDFADELGMGFYGLFNSGAIDLRVRRNGKWMIGGRLLDTVPALSADSNSFTLTAPGLLDELDFRHIHPGDTVSYSGEDIGQIAWNRIVDTQGRPDGDLGITLGVIEPSRNIEDEQAAFGKTVKELLIDYTDMSNSGDFEITADKQFNWFYPGLGTVRANHPFRYGNGGNIKRIVAPRSAAKLANVAYTRGANNGTAQVFSIRQNTSSRAAYGRHERVADHSSIQRQDLADSFGEETIRTSSSPSILPTIELYGDRTPMLSVYNLGDRVPIEIPNRPSFSHIHGQMLRLNEIEVSVDENDHEDVKVEASIV